MRKKTKIKAGTLCKVVCSGFKTSPDVDWQMTGALTEGEMALFIREDNMYNGWVIVMCSDGMASISTWHIEPILLNSTPI